MKCRVWYKLDGSVSVSHPDTRSGMKPKDMTMTQWITKQFDTVAEKNPEFRGLDYDDIDSSMLPVGRVDRDRWRGVKGQGVKIDKTIALRKDITKQLDDELALVAPDPVKVIKLQRDIINWKGK